MRRMWATVVALVLSSACAATPPDTVLLNGKVFTANPAQPWADAAAILGDRVIAVGTTNDIAARAGSSTRRLDLGGRTVVPGFNDAHFHVAPRPPKFQVTLPFDPAVADVERALIEANRTAPQGERVQAQVGLRVLDDASIDRQWLDARIPDRPAMLLAFTGHGMILNTAALRLAHIDEAMADPEGGRFGRDASGRLNGRVSEYAEQVVWRRIAALTPEAEAAETYRQTARQAAQFGVTTIQLMGDGQPEQKIVADLLAADTAIRWHVYRFPMKEAGQEWIDTTPVMPPQPSARIERRGMKWILDGTPLERLAALRAPYSDRPTTSGQMNFTRDRLRDIVKWGYGSEDQLALHAVGDATIAAYLETLEASGTAEVWRAKRPRLEHGDLFYPEFFAKAKLLGVVVVQNPTHLEFGPALERQLGAERMKEWQPLKRLLSEGIPLAIGSDGPLNPFLNLRDAVTHPDRPSEALSREEAITAYSRGSAYAELADKDKGHLSIGALADLAVLSADVFTVPLAQLPSITSVLTMVGGRIVHDAGVIH